jgi:hypothetical protein
MNTVQPELDKIFKQELAKIIKDRLVFERQGDRVEAKVYFNDFQVYRFYSTGMPEALEKMKLVMRRLTAFPFPIFNRQQVQENIVNCEVYYREMPAVIRDFDGYNGAVRIVPANPERVFPPEPWDGDVEPVGEVGCWEDLLSEKIYWFREREE